MTLPNNTIWHLGHSSNAIKIADTLLVFDYATPLSKHQKGDGLFNGRIIPEEIRQESVAVFISHGHEDHYTADIFEWSKVVPDINYFISYDIRSCPDRVHKVKPHQYLEMNGFSIRAYPSTDEGVALSIFIGGRHLYFSGDNAFWNWDGDLDDEIYLRLALADIDRSQPINVAFQVCDPRLERKGAGGIYIFAREFNPDLLIPVHSFGDYAFNRRVEQRLRKQGFDKRFWRVERAGESIRI
jgi:L-ascorbate metabolism protein UlaG (beta-lactamase superfamily)